MRKIVGKLAIIWLTLTVGVLCAVEPSIKLRIASIEGQEIETATVGEPFRLEVFVEGMGQVSQEIEVPGLDKINGRRNGYFLTTINGVSALKFNYQAQMDKSGVVTVGPVLITHEGKEIHSNKLRIFAKEGSARHGARSVRKKSATDHLLRFFVEKKEAVVGEKIPARLRFYSRSEEVHMRQLNQRELPAFTVSPFEGPLSGQEMVDGQMYRYAEWRWNLYPKETGKLVIPAYSIDFDKVIKSNTQWSFFSFFGSRMETAKVHSNAQVITVRALPAHKGPVFLVGNLAEVTAEITPDTTTVGQAVLLAIEVEGEGNIEGIEQITLTDLPAALKYYDSKNILLEKSKVGRFTRKRFEYVLQGLQEGMWEIPAQTFTYYDVHRNTYDQKSTAPLKITILPGSPIELPENNNAEVERVQSGSSVIELGPVNTRGPWNSIPQRAGLPWWLFVFLVLLPFICICGVFAWHIIYRWYIAKARFRNAYKRAHAQLVIAQNTRDSRRVYYIMKAVIADRLGISIEKVSPESIRDALQTAGMSQDKLAEWDDFALLLSEQVFAHHDYKPEIFTNAHLWLNEWERLI